MTASRALITIDGVDGSGKSVLARRLIAALGSRALALAVDDVRRPIDWTRTDRSELDLYYDERYELPALDACLAAFVAGAPSASYLGFDGAREALGPRHEISFAGVDHLIVEGIFIARLAHAENALRIFVELSAAEARRRVRVRDQRKGRTIDEVDRRIDQRYLPAFARYLAETDARDRATVVIDNEDAHAPRLIRTTLAAGGVWEPARLALAGLVAGAW